MEITSGVPQVKKPDKIISFHEITQGDVNHGWIRKQTPGNRALERFSKTILKYQWPKRIIVLKNGCLYAYKNENNSKPCVAVSLYGFTKVEKLEDRGDKPYQKWGFTLEHTQEFEGSVMRFAALTEQDRQEWLEKISREIEKVNFVGGKPLPPPPVPKRRSETGFDDDEPDVEDMYWSIKDTLQSQGEVPKAPEAWPTRPPPPPPDIPPAVPKRSSGYESMNGLFGKAFHTSSTAERILDKCTDDGVYIIRNHSDVAGRRTLSVKYQGGIRKFAVNYDNGQYLLEMEKQLHGPGAIKFPNMDELLRHYRIKSLPSKGNLQIKLWIPYSDHPDLQ